MSYSAFVLRIPNIGRREEELAVSALPPKRGGRYVLAHQGRLVSQIEIFHNQIRMHDGILRVASIGGVCTHPDYRNQGLTSHLLEYCTRKSVQEGARLMLISGARGVYTRLGNVPHGRFTYFSLSPEQSSSWRSAPPDLVLRRLTGADTLPVSRLYQAEPVHYIRQHGDYSAALHNPLENTYVYADQWIVERAGQAMAYLFLGLPWECELEAGMRHVSEYAGSRLALVDALNALLTTGNLRETLLASRLARYGTDATAAGLWRLRSGGPFGWSYPADRRLPWLYA